MKIVVLDGYAINPGDLSWDAIGAQGELVVYERTAPEEAAARIGDAECVFTNKAVFSAETINNCPNLKFIGVLATGYNVVDVAAAKERGVVVCNVPAYSTDAVAQLTFGLLLEICFGAGEHSAAVHQGMWESCADFSFRVKPLMELNGKTLGVIGFGQIGQRVAGIAAAMGMKIIAHNGQRQPELPAELARCTRFGTLEDIYREADVITLHAPLTPTTTGLINKDSIGKMKDGVIIINTSRGGAIVEQDLADALNSGKVYAAGLDVVSAEPIHKDNPLNKARGIVFTPHIGWAPLEARQRLMAASAENLRRFLAGDPINVVSK